MSLSFPRGKDLAVHPIIAFLSFESPYIIESIFQNGFSVNNCPYMFAYLYVANLFYMRGKAGIVTLFCFLD